MTDLEVDLSEVDLAAPEHRENPHPVYRALRSTDPFFPSPLEDRTYLLTRFADCEAVLRDPRWSSDPSHGTVDAAEMDVRTAMSATEANVLLFTDPPDHTRIRKLMSKAFTPRTVERLRPKVQELVDGLLDDVEARGEVEIVSEIGYTVPVTVICEMLGVPVADRDLFGPWSSDASRLLDGVLDEETTNRGLMGAMQIIGYLGNLIDERRRDPQDDLLTALVHAEDEGATLSEEELRINTLLLFVAGHETTMNLIGNGMCALLRDRDQFDRLRADPTLIGTTVEELLRFDGPVHISSRTATVDVEVNGHAFFAGDKALTILAAANRDPARFTDPERLDIGRDEGPHLTFSYGIHYCLGAALARLEGQVVINSLVQRFGAMQILTDPVTYRDHFVLRGLKELRVSV
jgi:cytochrome P450